MTSEEKRCDYVGRNGLACGRLLPVKYETTRCNQHKATKTHHLCANATGDFIPAWCRRGIQADEKEVCGGCAQKETRETVLEMAKEIGSLKEEISRLTEQLETKAKIKTPAK